MQVDSFEKLYVDQLRDMYNAEKQLVRALPKMAKSASSSELRSALEEHLDVTTRQVERLEEIFQDLGRPATGKTCKGMAGIVEEGQEILNEDSDPDVLDAGIIAAAQKVEHYEIASYGTLRTFAEAKGDTKAARILEEILDQEKEADRKLTQVAEASVNPRAQEGTEGDVDREPQREKRTRGTAQERTRQGENKGGGGSRERGDGPWL